MDLWVIAATAATGYIAKYWQNLSKGRDKLPEFSSEEFCNKTPESPRCPLSRMAHRKKSNHETSTVRRIKFDGDNPDAWQSDDGYGATVPSTGGESSVKPNDANAHSSSSRVPGFLENEHGNWVSNDVSVSETGVYSFQDSFRNKAFLSRKLRSGGLKVQLHKEQSIMEEHLLSPFPSPCTPIMRALLVTDGTQVITRNNGDSSDLQIENEGKNGRNVCGAPLLPKMESNWIKLKTGKDRHGRSNNSSKLVGARCANLNTGSHDAAVMFCLGISVGIISSFVASENEMGKLKHALKQTENLVQDLQEELEMEDSLTTKELMNENSNSWKKMDDLDDGKEHFDETGDENSESMSKIEAELEAELERLELSMNTSSMERRSSDKIELEPDFIEDFAQGELRADKIKGHPLDQAESDKRQSGNSTPPLRNYAVSPCELSLRLHEVIQSRLEARVKELEIALQESQRVVEQLKESEKKNSWNKLWENHESARNEMKPKIQISSEDNEYYPMAQPLAINLAGEALEAYNEAYEELMKVNYSEEEDSLPEACKWKNTSWSRKINLNESLREPEESIRAHELLDLGGMSEEEADNSDLENEMEKQLIKQIVEKTKQGSPVVLNAQKLLLLMDDENER